MKPTFQIYSELQQAFDHFNKEFFGNILPECILILYSKEHRVMGYFMAGQFIHQNGSVCDAIALNPQYFAVRRIIETMQTVVHEMCHAWQHHFGKDKSSRVYHNREWADKMESVGLMPSSTGMPGGNRTGQKMNDYPIPGGLFERACQRLVTPKYSISWMDRFSVNAETAGVVSTLSVLGMEEGPAPEQDVEKQNKSNRIKYTCPACQVNIWGKKNLNVLCGDCEEIFVPSVLRNTILLAGSSLASNRGNI